MARAWAWAWAGAGAWAGKKWRISDFVDFVMGMEQALEEGESVFPKIAVGNCVLVECSQRWYIGRVCERNSMSFSLELAGAAGQIGDLGQFLDGVITADTDISPTPDQDISFADVCSVYLLTEGKLLALRRRTHARKPARTDLPN